MVVVVATILCHINCKEGPAVINNGLIPFQLIERFETQAIAKTLRHIQHVDRNQTFLDFGARAAERSGVERVDGVDRVTDKGTFTPADNLPANTYGARQIAYVIVVVEKGIQNFCSG